MVSFTFLFIFGQGGTAASDSLRCGSRIVSTEDSTAAVKAVCGEPALRDVLPQVDPETGDRYDDVEVWTYNFGSSQLLRLLRFRNGRLIEIETEGYGFRPPENPRCTPYDIVNGESKYRLLAFCGEPETRRVLSPVTPYPAERRYRKIEKYRGPATFTVQYREEWRYNFGSRSFLSRVILENGRVAYTESEGRGYDPR